MIDILIGVVLLSAIHAAIPSHWLPVVAISKAEHWSRATALGITTIIGAAHTLSTVLIGIVIGVIGKELHEVFDHVTHIVAPLVIIVWGMIYLILGEGHSHHHAIDERQTSRKSKAALIASLSIAMFFSPCLEIQAYFFNVGIYGWLGIVSVALVYVIVSILGMVTLVFFGLRGVEKIKLTLLERHERSVTGIVLIILGILVYLG